MSLLDKCKIGTKNKVLTGNLYRNLSTFRYRKVPVFKSLSFIWLDEILNSCTDDLNETIQPFSWNFFENIFECLSFIENQVREEKQIFLVVSGSLGRQVFASGYEFMRTVSFVYIYCSQLGEHNDWIQTYSDIRGAFNDSSKLQRVIKADLDKVRQVQVGSNPTGLSQFEPRLQVRHD